jgi:hypothetical protein
MSAAKTPVWKDTYATVAVALDLHLVTIKHMVRDGEYPAVKFGSSKRPIVRLMPPAEFLRLKGRWSGPQPVDTVPELAE